MDRSLGRHVRPYTETRQPIRPKDPAGPRGGECYKAYPGLGNRSIFYPGSSVGSTITGVLQLVNCTVIRTESFVAVVQQQQSYRTFSYAGVLHIPSDLFSPGYDRPSMISCFVCGPCCNYHLPGTFLEIYCIASQVPMPPVYGLFSYYHHTGAFCSFLPSSQDQQTNQTHQIKKMCCSRICSYILYLAQDKRRHFLLPKHQHNPAYYDSV